MIASRASLIQISNAIRLQWLYFFIFLFLQFSTLIRPSNSFNNLIFLFKGPCGIYGSNYPQMKCHNIALNNSQGHPGKEGPSGEKGHMVSFITFASHELAFISSFLYLRFSHFFVSPPVVLVQKHLHKMCLHSRR